MRRNAYPGAQPKTEAVQNEHATFNGVALNG